MPNKTIYVADEKLWEQAKRLAGKDGLSSVVNSAIKNFVDEASGREQGFEKQLFEIFGDPHLSGPTDVIGFEGKLLYSANFDLVANPFQPDSSTPGVEASIAVYRTRSGKFVLLAEPAIDAPTSQSAYAMWETHSSISELMNGLVVGCLFDPNRYEFLNELSKHVGTENVTWID